jgi:hypothetical protein
MTPSQATPRARRAAWIAVLIGSIAACAKPTAPQATVPAEHALTVERTLLVGEPVQTELEDAGWSERILPGPVFACTRDDDCEVIQLDCCDRCEDGRRLAVNRTHIEEANAAYRDDGCATAVCEPLSCPQAFTPVCDGGACARREETTSADGTLEATIVRNVVPRR